MVGVTTVALIERRPDITRSLFTRYWRDVHGVMAARIPGFDTYTQHHVTPLDPSAEPFEGIAIVTYANEADRAGLINSDVTQHIHRDEQNVFRRALLYNLGEGDDAIVTGSRDADGQTMFVVIPNGEDPTQIIDHLSETAIYLATYNLLGGDPSGWNKTDISGCAFELMAHGIWPDRETAIKTATGIPAAYLLDESHVMVDGGRVTPIGLRGFDAVKTILEAKADNQLTVEVARAIYGDIAAA